MELASLTRSALARAALWATIALAPLAGCSQPQPVTVMPGTPLPPSIPPLSPGDANFIAQAAQASLLETQLGLLAGRRGVAAPVLRFGHLMAADNTRLIGQLAALAQQKHIPLPDTLNGPSQQVYDRLSGLHGDAFDRAYAQTMVQQHEADTWWFRDELETGIDPDLKAWAAQSLPILQQHLDMARRLPSR